MRHLTNFVRSLNGPAFLLLVSTLTLIAVLLILIAFSLVKPSMLRWW